MGSPLPRIFARVRKLEAEPIAPSFSSLAATLVKVEPSGTTNAVCLSSGPEPYQPCSQKPTARRAMAARERRSLRRLIMNSFVTLNLFQGPTSILALRLEQRWMLKQVQHDEF